MNRIVLHGLLALGALVLGLAGAASADDAALPGDFAFPADIAAQEEAAAHGTAAVPAEQPQAKAPAAKLPAVATPPGKQPKPAKPTKPATSKPQAPPQPVADEAVPASNRPLPVVDYSLTPEALASAKHGPTNIQRSLLKAADDGKSTMGDMVKLISSTGGDQLDHIVINIANQHIYECNASGEAIHEDLVSTGAHGLDTPPGDYTVHNKAPKAFSQKYTAWMLQWMGLTDDGSYGMHGLEGSSYERRLGHQASHGCVRLSRKYAKDLYPRVKVGMPVSIVNDKDLKLAAFQPLSEQAATAQVMDLLSPADPDALFY